MRVLPLLLLACAPTVEDPVPAPPGIDANCTLDEHFFDNDNETPVRLLSTSNALSVNVQVEDPGPVSLVLVGGPAAWNVTDDGSGAVDTVWVAVEIDLQRVRVPENTRVERFSVTQGFGFAPPFESWDEPGARSFQTELGNRGVTLSSVHACAEGTAKLWTVGEMGEVDELPPPPDCSLPSEPMPPRSFAGVDRRCPQLASAEVVCVTKGRTVHAIDPLSSKSCDLGIGEIEQDIDGFKFSRSIGWQGEHLYFCGEYGMVSRVDLDTGELETSHTYCRDVSTTTEGLFIRPLGAAPTGVRLPSFYDAQCRRPWQNLVAMPPAFSVLGDHLYTFEQADDTVEVRNLVTLGREVRAEMDGAPFITGLSATDPYGVWFLNDNVTRRTIGRFDVVEGRVAHELPVEFASHGLACARR